MILLVIPFLRERDERGSFVHPPLHLRPYTPAELEQHRRMVRKQEALRHAWEATP